MHPLFSIGHSNHAIEEFGGLLRAHSIGAVADVRSSPYSKFNPQFNRQPLEGHLRTLGIHYVFLGSELGARSQDPDCYVEGRVSYERLARTEAFRSGIRRLLQGANDYRIAVLCAEKDPLECHRTLLISNALAERGIDVGHILADGSLELHQASMDRLLKQYGSPGGDLFQSRDELLTDALGKQQRRIAYVAEGEAE